MKARKQRSREKEKELAVQLHTRRNDPAEWEPTPVRADVSPRRAVVTSVRMPVAEFLALQKAAGAAGQTVSDYVRTAIAMRLRGMIRVSSVHIAVAAQARSQATFVAPHPEAGQTENPDPEIDMSELKYANL
jgi:hypothetical protein